MQIVSQRLEEVSWAPKTLREASSVQPFIDGSDVLPPLMEATRVLLFMEAIGAGGRGRGREVAEREPGCLLP
eukprot:1149220-Rhodomonas_salina.1